MLALLKHLLGLSELAAYRALWLVAAAALALFLTRAAHFAIERYLVLRKLLPTSFRARQHFSSSIFWLISGALGKAVLPFLELHPRAESAADTAANVVMLLGGAWTLMRVARLVRIILYSHLDIRSPDNLRQRRLRTQLQFIEKIFTLVVGVIAVSLILMNFDGARRIGGSLIASAGLAGVVLGFAAQKSLGNLLAGFQIAFTQPIRIDDAVIVEGEFGRIEEITLTYVVIRIWDRRALVVPITFFVEKAFQNWTRVSSDILGTVFLNLDYSAPIEEIRREFSRILRETRLWDGVASGVQVTDASERTLQVRLLMGARNASESFDLRCLVREKMIAFLQEHFPASLPMVRLTREHEEIAELRH